MVKLIKSFKFFKYRKYIFSILLFLNIFFPNPVFASETYGDAMNWYKNNGSSYKPRQNYLLGLKAEQEGDIKKALTYFRNAANNNLTIAQIKLSKLLLNSNNTGCRIVQISSKYSLDGFFKV